MIIDNPGNYDWNYQFVNGGFFTLSKLRKKPKRYFIFIYLGGFKFKYGWATAFSSHPTEKLNPEDYKMTVNFNTVDFENHLKDEIDGLDNLKPYRNIQ